MLWLKNFWEEEDGMGTIEMILIIVIIIALVITFRKKLTSLINTLFTRINKDIKEAINYFK